jgi:hypothetical protein
MALLLTEADANRRSSAQGSQAGGRQKINSSAAKENIQGRHYTPKSARGRYDYPRLKAMAITLAQKHKPRRTIRINLVEFALELLAPKGVFGRQRNIRLSGQRASLTDGYIGMGLARNELMTPSVKRVGLHSPPFARRTIFLATDVAMGVSRLATFNRFKASSKAVVMAAMSSGPNTVLISRRVISMSLSYGCESEELPGCQQGSAS